VREGKVQLTQTEKDKLLQALSALESLRQAFTGVSAAAADLAERAKNFSLTQHRLSTGLSAKLDVVIAQADLAQAKDLNSEAIATYRLAWVNLIHSMGNMGNWIEEMKEP
jgi:outer membrane protein TolC